MTGKILARPALALAIGAVGLVVAEAQQPAPLDAYSDDWTGGQSPAPAGATRPTVITVAVPRLRALVVRMQALQNTLDTHPIPPHSHSHTHPPPPTLPTGTTVTYTDPDQRSDGCAVDGVRPGDRDLDAVGRAHEGAGGAPGTVVRAGG